MSDKKTITMLDLSGSPEFNSIAAVDALNTIQSQPYVSQNVMTGEYSFISQVPKEEQKSRREKVHRTLQRFGLATAGASMASPLTAPITESVGAVADLTDSILYGLEGKYGAAALSMAAILPFVGGVVATRRAAVSAKKAGEDMFVGYRAVPEYEEAISTPKDIKSFFGDSYASRAHIGGPSQELKNLSPSEYLRKMSNISSLEFEQGSALADKAYIHAFRKSENIIAKTGPEGLSVSTSPFAAHLTSSPQSALYYAMDQGLGPNVAMKIIKYEIPISEIKKLENINMGDFGGKAVKSNDYFLKKIHNIGTGRTTPYELVGDKLSMGRMTSGREAVASEGFRDVIPGTIGRKGFSNKITPGNNVTIFEGGLDAGYTTVFRGDNLEDIIKKYPELKGTELDNSAIINSLKKRGMSTDVRAYDFHEFTNPNFKQRLIDVDDMHEVAKKIGTDFLDPADFLNQYLKITGIK